MCDPSLKLLDVFTGHAGSVHNSCTFRASGLKAMLESEDGRLPGDMHLLGDSAYPLADYLLVPYKDNRDLSSKEKTQFCLFMHPCHSWTFNWLAKGQIPAPEVLGYAQQNGNGLCHFRLLCLAYYHHHDECGWGWHGVGRWRPWWWFQRAWSGISACSNCLTQRATITNDLYYVLPFSI